ncbi:shikimate kinase family protein [Galdieria sulphuraria]|uniref:gluconokinase n=1 Tax=Galdieria sulphuraria TaxID=130081 RepID=M2Y9F5_GALSU|nr:shikimate kinase family protein [Galdieria sulphuraria]EME32499.1 shikimate kinase family protein [Galdieria sulphuraria]|eukprot:XP_005709019.1 shikimate kinase family protein [Galdieria sulphuraria]
MGVVVIFIGGVSGVGKTTVAKECSCKLGNSCFLDADDFHSIENKQKMKQGIPLSDSGNTEKLSKIL